MPNGKHKSLNLAGLVQYMQVVFAMLFATERCHSSCCARKLAYRAGSSADNSTDSVGDALRLNSAGYDRF